MDDKMIKLEMNKICESMSGCYKLIDRIENTNEVYHDVNTRINIFIPFSMGVLNYQLVDKDGNEAFLFEVPIIQENKNHNKYADICAVSKEKKIQQIIVESKPSNIDLDNCVEQLENYMYNSNEATLGMLIKFNEFRFYKKGTNNKLILFWKIDIRNLTPYDKKILYFCRNDKDKLLFSLRAFDLLYTQTLMEKKNKEDKLVEFIGIFEKKESITINENGNNIVVTKKNVKDILKANYFSK